MSTKLDLKYNNTLITSLTPENNEVILSTAGKYCANDINAEMNIDWYEGEIDYVKQPIGGQIFYIHSDNGATYKFWDASDNELTTQTVEGLQNATKYAIVSGTPTADKFYVLNTSVGTSGLATNLKWDTVTDTECGTKNYNYIGGGKPATALVLPSLGDTSGTIWHWLKNTVNTTGNSTGCTDWYIGSAPNNIGPDDANTELGKLRNAISTYPSIFANQSAWFTTNAQNIWSSIEYSEKQAIVWYKALASSVWSFINKTGTYYVCAIRSF